MEEVATAIQLELIQSSHKVEMEDLFLSKFLDSLWFHLLVIDALVPGGEKGTWWASHYPSGLVLFDH